MSVCANEQTANSQRLKATLILIIFPLSEPLTPERTSHCSGRLDLRSSPALARHNWSKLRSALASGRSSDFPQSALPSRTPPRSPPLRGEGEGVGCSVALHKQTLLRRITAAGTVPDSHRIPLHQAASATRLPLSVCKDTTFLDI